MQIFSAKSENLKLNDLMCTKTDITFSDFFIHLHHTHIHSHDF